jgi:hypothetical protein
MLWFTEEAGRATPGFFYFGAALLKADHAVFIMRMADKFTLEP